MTDAYNNPTSHADVIPEVWSTTAIIAATNATNNALIGLAANASDMLDPGGDKINFPVQSVLAFANISQTTNMSLQQASMTLKTLTVNKHKGNPYHITSQASALSNQDIGNNFFRQAGLTAAKTLDAALAALRTSAALNVAANTSLNITEAQIAEAKEDLDGANAPMEGRYLVVNAQQYGALLQIARFTEADKTGTGAPILTGALGMIYGFSVFLDQNIEEVASNVGKAFNLYGVYSPDPHQSSLVYAYGKFKDLVDSGPAVVDVPELGMRAVTGWNNGRYGETMNFEMLFGVAAVRSEWLGTLDTQD